MHFQRCCEQTAKPWQGPVERLLHAGLWLTLEGRGVGADKEDGEERASTGSTTSLSDDDW